MNGLFERVASAPITWGVIEVPGWGHQLSPARVLREMRELGLRASELGPEGYFALDRSVARQIESSGFLIIAGFIPVVYREATGLSEAMAGLDQATRRLSGTGAELAVLAVASDQTGYEAQLTLDARGWTALADFLPPGLVNDLIGRGKIAATFAACLELTRQGRLRLRQSKPFAPLFLRGVAKPS